MDLTINISFFFDLILTFFSAYEDQKLNIIDKRQVFIHSFNRIADHKRVFEQLVRPGSYLNFTTGAYLVAIPLLKAGQTRKNKQDLQASETPETAEGSQDSKEMQKSY